MQLSESLPTFPLPSPETRTPTMAASSSLCVCGHARHQHRHSQLTPTTVHSWHPSSPRSTHCQPAPPQLSVGLNGSSPDSYNWPASLGSPATNTCRYAPAHCHPDSQHESPLPCRHSYENLQQHECLRTASPWPPAAPEPAVGLLVS